MLDNLKSLLEGEILIDVTKNNERIIIETSFYDKEHKMNSVYPCINTCIIDSDGKDWFTVTYFSWTDFINEINAYISYYEAETPQNANYVYIRECDFL